jgi:hypothetical protein
LLTEIASRELFGMELYLTLAIAVGGIATGIGAIWTAIVARRELREQREFIRAQNERARINLEEDLISRLWQQWMSPSYEEFKIKSIEFIKENLLVNGEFLEPKSLDASTMFIYHPRKKSYFTSSNGCSS